MLPDLLKENLKVVFCGTGVGNKSARQEAYYAGCGNKFYCILYNVGITPTQLIPSDYEKLLDYNIGLTDLVKGKAGMDRNFQREHYDVEAFKVKIEKFKPELICFNGKEAAKVYFGLDRTSLIKYGLQDQHFDTTKFFISPSTSPTAHQHWREEYWLELAKLVRD